MMRPLKYDWLWLVARQQSLGKSDHWCLHYAVIVVEGRVNHTEIT